MFDAPINLSFNTQQKKTPNTHQFIVLLLLIPQKNTLKKLGFHHTQNLVRAGATEYTHHRFSQYRDSRSKFLGLNLCKSVFIRTQSPIHNFSTNRSRIVKRTQFPTWSFSLNLTQFLMLSLSLSFRLNFSLKRTQSLSQIVSPITLS